MTTSAISKILDNFLEEGIKLSPIGATMLVFLVLMIN